MRSLPLLVPRSFDDLNGWAERNDISPDEARRRLAQFLILSAIASVPWLRHHLVFKGGNALDFILQPNRSTIDLDFSVTGSERGGADTPGTIDVEVIRRALERGCRLISNASGASLTVHRVR